MIIVIVGPTCVGKTKLSVELAKALNGEIINADSTQVYKGMNIATAKVTEEEKENVPHYLFDQEEITDDYTIFNYQKDCRNFISTIQKKEKTPILVGGTGLYIKAALYDYQFDVEETEIEIEGTTEELYKRLIQVDSNTEIHPNNRKRIIRALTYYYQNGKPMSAKEKADEPIYNVVFIGLTTDRENLYNRINRRVLNMVDNGLLEEAKEIYDSNIRTKAVLTPIGYKELFPYFDGTNSLDESISKIQQNSRKYAKRQYTWFRHQLPVHWFDVHYENFDETVEEVLSFVRGEK